MDTVTVTMPRELAEALADHPATLREDDPKLYWVTKVKAGVSLLREALASEAEVVAWRYRQRGTTGGWHYTDSAVHVTHIRRQTRLVPVQGRLESVPVWDSEALVRLES